MLSILQHDEFVTSEAWDSRFIEVDFPVGGEDENPPVRGGHYFSQAPKPVDQVVVDADDAIALLVQF